MSLAPTPPDEIDSESWLLLSPLELEEYRLGGRVGLIADAWAVMSSKLVMITFVFRDAYNKLLPSVTSQVSSFFQHLHTADLELFTYLIARASLFDSIT